MTAATVAVREPGRIGNATFLCAIAIIAVIAWAAVTVIACGAQGQLRQFLQFGFEGVPRTASQVQAIAVHNASIAAGPLIAAGLVRILQPIQIGVQIVLAAVLISNSALIGLALGAYGWRLVGAVAVHLPLEVAAFCLAGGTYIAALHQPLRRRTLAASASGCVALLIAAAVAETYLPPGTL